MTSPHYFDHTDQQDREQREADEQLRRERFMPVGKSEHEDVESEETDGSEHVGATQESQL